MWSGRADDLEESGDEPEVVIDEGKSRRGLDSVSVNIGRTPKRRNSTHLQRFRSHF